MKTKKTYNWSPPKWLENPVKETVLFHDAEVEVYSGTVEVKEIRLWRDNDRTTLDLEHLLQELGKKDVQKLSDQEIVSYVFEQGLHKIQELAGSIKKNGIRVPLVLSYDKQLLDGNRRFLACKYLIEHEEEMSEKFTKAPVNCLKPDIDDELKLKIIAEMNFLEDYKEPWPRNVRARFAVNQFNKFFEKLGDEDEAYEQVTFFLEITKPGLQSFREILEMIDEYIIYSERNIAKTKQAAERFARTKFHFFEEFYNKTRKGKNPIKSRKSLKAANQLLYKYILNQQLSSTIKVRELAQIIRYEPTRIHLEKPRGNFELARAIYQDYARPKEAATKIIHFCEWIESLSKREKAELPIKLKKRLFLSVKSLVVNSNKQI